MTLCSIRPFLWAQLCSIIVIDFITRWNSWSTWQESSACQRNGLSKMHCDIWRKPCIEKKKRKALSGSSLRLTPGVSVSLQEFLSAGNQPVNAKCHFLLGFQNWSSQDKEWIWKILWDVFCYYSARVDHGLVQTRPLNSPIPTCFHQEVMQDSATLMQKVFNE